MSGFSWAWQYTARWFRLWIQNAVAVALAVSRHVVLIPQLLVVLYSLCPLDTVCSQGPFLLGSSHFDFLASDPVFCHLLGEGWTICKDDTNQLFKTGYSVVRVTLGAWNAFPVLWASQLKGSLGIGPSTCFAWRPHQSPKEQSQQDSEIHCYFMYLPTSKIHCWIKYFLSKFNRKK